MRSWDEQCLRLILRIYRFCTLLFSLDMSHPYHFLCVLAALHVFLLSFVVLCYYSYNICPWLSFLVSPTLYSRAPVLIRPDSSFSSSITLPVVHRCVMFVVVLKFLQSRETKTFCPELYLVNYAPFIPPLFHRSTHTVLSIVHSNFVILTGHSLCFSCMGNMN